MGDIMVLSGLRNLSELTLHFDLEDGSHMKPVKRCAVSPYPGGGECLVAELKQPLLSASDVRQIFSSLRVQSIYNGGEDCKLRRLNAYLGNYDRREGGGYRIDTHFEHNAPQRFCVLRQTEL